MRIGPQRPVGRGSKRPPSPQRGRLALGPAPRHRPRRGRWLRWVLLALAVAIGVVRLGFFELVRVRGNHMAPTLLEGDVAAVSLRDRPRLGDVVLVEFGGRTVVRRVLGMPGDYLGALDGVLTRNGLPLETQVVGRFSHRDPGANAVPVGSGVVVPPTDPDAPGERPMRQRWLREVLDDQRAHGTLGDYSGSAVPWRLTLEPVQVPPGHLFVLCDNRPTCPGDETTGVVPLRLVRGVLRAAVWFGEARGPEAGITPGYGAFAPLASTVPGGSAGGEGSAGGRPMPGLK